MKHQHEISDADINLNVDLPTQDMESLVEKITDSVITVIVVATVAKIVKFHLTR